MADEIFPIDIPIGVGAMRPNSQYARPGFGNSAGAGMTGLRGTGSDVGRGARLGSGNDGWATLSLARASCSSRVVS